MCYGCVSILSSSFAMYAGVRQGGLLCLDSNSLCYMYLDNLIQLLKWSGFGCINNDTFCFLDACVMLMTLS